MPHPPLAISRFKPPATGRRDHPDGATPGLNLRVSAHDGWTWTLRVRGVGGGQRRFTLGTFTDAQGLKWARAEAEAMRQKVRRERHDPHRARKQAAAAAAAQQKERNRLTLQALVNDRQRIHLAHRGPRNQAEAVRALKHAVARQWEQPAEALDRAAVVSALDDLQRPSKAAEADDATGPAATKGQGQVIAARTAAYGRACYAWAGHGGAWQPVPRPPSAGQCPRP